MKQLTDHDVTAFVDLFRKNLQKTGYLSLKSIHSNKHSKSELNNNNGTKISEHDATNPLRVHSANDDSDDNNDDNDDDDDDDDGNGDTKYDDNEAGTAPFKDVLYFTSSDEEDHDIIGND